MRLKRLEAEHNKLLALPDTLQDMQALQTVKLGMNALSWLPDSLTKLANLTEYVRGRRPAVCAVEPHGTAYLHRTTWCVRY